MNNITIKSSSKINLFLSIGKRLPNGYHKISSVFSEINVSDILNVLRIVREKSGIDADNVYMYVMPFELANYNEEVLSKKVGKKVNVFAVNDKKKYDPEGKASKAKPGKPGIFVE